MIAGMPCACSKCGTQTTVMLVLTLHRQLGIWVSAISPEGLYTLV